MPNIISLDTGILTIDVQVDKSRTHTLSFNPHDVTFLQRGHQIYLDALERDKRLRKEKENFKPAPLDENGVPTNIEAGTKLILEANTWFREQIDLWLGAGTSQAIFGDVLFADEKLGVYVQLISGVMDYVKPERAQKVEQFILPRQRAKRVRKK